MELDQVQYLALDGPILPTAAAQITEEQRTYRVDLDPEAPELDFEAILYRAGLDNYASIVINDHGIQNGREFSELQEGGIKLFCKVARDRVMFRKLLKNLVGTESTVLHPTHDNLHWASRDLNIQLLPSHYSTGQLILRCLAEVGTVYSEVSQAPLESSRKEPIPERVTSPNGSHRPQAASPWLSSFLTMAVAVVTLALQLQLHLHHEPHRLWTTSR
ncbi:uncharacterized protein LOC135702931 [Ochlerotatus camptorhynchus]|uniref:uncharacterized protein LOC135702931 n=1 Tax=Ochlerotatus camptorhynchus TaxID=644619 RepID=UPI0031D39618